MITTESISLVKQRLPIDRLLELDGVRHRGRSWYCPFHDDRTPSASVKFDRLHCFTCNKWWDAIDYLRQRHGYDFQMAVRHLADLACVSIEPTRSVPRRVVTATPPISRAAHVPEQAERGPRPELAAALTAYQNALPGSLGEQYLRARGIPLGLARSFGLGFAGQGKWLHRRRDWKFGRLVIPHTDPEGIVMNLYGRAIDGVEPASRDLRHDHLPAPKGYFNAPALKAVKKSVLYVCEGPFDALSIIAAGYPHTIGIFGVSGWRWEWAFEIEKLCFCFDADASGQNAWRKLAISALSRRIRIAHLPPNAYGGHKDANDAWVAGLLNIGAWPDE